MIRTIIVDDEAPAIAKLERLLSAYPRFQLIASYTEAMQALTQASDLKPQVAFLDISMPVINGIELAAQLRKKLGNNIFIVFITAYSEYALSAYDVFAVDYLTKPVSRARFARSIERLTDLILALASPPIPLAIPYASSPMVCMFGRLQICGNGTADITWRTAKVRELFAYYMHNRTRKVYKNQLLERLWPELPQGKALSNLNTCNYYLRESLKQSKCDLSLEYGGGYYWIDLHSCLCDVDVFEKSVQLAKEGIRESTLPTLLDAVSLYRGIYLEDVKCTWADIDRGIFADHYISVLLAAAEWYLHEKQYAEAIKMASQIVDINPLHSGAWHVLMSAYESIGDSVQLQQTQKRYERVFLENASPKRIEQFEPFQK